jgi:hypothetical protein
MMSGSPATLRSRVLLSFITTVAGYVAGAFAFHLWQSLPGNSLDDDSVRWLIWTAIFTTLGWWLGFVPLVVYINVTSPFWTRRVLPFAGMAMALTMYMALIGWVFMSGASRNGEWGLPGIAAVQALLTGGISGWMYAALVPGIQRRAG